MLAIVFSWLIIMLAVIPLGLLVLRTLRNPTRKLEFTIIDIFLCGVGAVAAIACVFSLWIPANECLLIVILAISLSCLMKYRKEWIVYFKRSYSRYKLLLLFIIILAFVMIPVWVNFTNHDPLFYHYSNIKWNETYAVVPGLANLEERFGFNSNYLLLCSLFSLRVVFGDLIIGFQSLLAVLISCWMLNEMLKSNYENKRIILQVLYFIFIYINRVELATSSTDIIPNLVVIYLFSNIILHPHRLKYPTYVLIPIIMITFKLSSALLLILSLYPFFYYAKNKDYKTIALLSVLSLFVLTSWMTRNVIISGYLIFPYWQIDLFNFDWKVPINIPQNEQLFIKEYAVNKFIRIISDKNQWLYGSGYFSAIVSYMLSFIACISSVVLLYLRKNKLPKTYFYIFLCLIINYIFWIVFAPDIRFGYGFVFSIIYFMLFLCFTTSGNRNEKSLFPIELVIARNNGWIYKANLKNICMFIFVLFILYSSFNWASQYRYFLADNYNFNKLEAHLAIIYKPITTDQETERVLKLEEFEGEIYTPHKLNESVVIFTSNMKKGFFFDIIPIMRNYHITHSGFIQDYKDIEARGTSIKDGFRSVNLHE